ncbi:hypothetical protein [Halalkalicoccus subterraneus]|nr:hypothetical protein [Halalkalicoccus subterraneus]
MRVERLEDEVDELRKENEWLETEIEKLRKETVSEEKFSEFVEVLENELV